MKPVLTTFFQSYPIEGNMKVALKMIKKQIEHAIEDLDEKEDGNYMKHLSDAHRMLEAIYTELGSHPNSYR